MSCTLAAIAAMLGYTPQPGAVVSVPSAYVAQLSAAQVSQAKACARRHRIRWRVVD